MSQRLRRQWPDLLWLLVYLVLITAALAAR